MNETVRIDSHCHLLSMERKGLNPTDLLDEFQAAGGRGLLDVAIDHRDWDKRLEWVKGRVGVGVSSGIHPSETSSFADGWAEIERQSLDPRCWAIGEIGLDWFHGREHETEQRDLFRAQLRLAQARRLPVIIHNRLADKEILEDLNAVGWSGEGIFHCFSSNDAMARAGLERGLSISFAGNVTYPKSQELRATCAWIPGDRLLVETDAPYLPPQPIRGQVNRPLMVAHTVQAVALARGSSIEATWDEVEATFRRIFSRHY